jgi:sarcosine oxidase, subunit alpha
VGLRCAGDAEGFVAGAHLLDKPLQSSKNTSAGYLTSAVLGPSLGYAVGLGLLRDGRARLGETVYVVNDSKQSRATVVNPAHYDPQGERLNA